jgi:hypothetical protein
MYNKHIHVKRKPKKDLVDKVTEPIKEVWKEFKKH